MIRNTLFCLSIIIATAGTGCEQKNTETTTLRKTSPEPVLVVTNIVKPAARPLYEKFMKEVLMHSLSARCTKAGVSNASFLTPEKQNDDSTWTYMLIIPAPATGGSYSISEILADRYSSQKATEYQSIYASCLKCPPVVNKQIASK